MPPLRTGIVHLIRRDPLGVVEFGLDLFAPHLLRYVGDANPQHTYGCRMSSRLIIDGEFNFVGLVDINIMQLIGPSVGPSSFSPANEGIFNFHDDEGFWSSRKSPSSSVVDIFNGVYTHGQMSSERFAHVWGV